ncbi:acyl carrier protein [Dactylosporangium sp. AC04546]|uniref:acyl carrier protein n=1 Tax=unclassified Dactylosporangium TaxID=2621675 RepID=UPI001EDD02A8|nr:acyl carrier protein [Dactylosporangium sp. AC04546]WVK81310.1 acyl carrier protein [Dactylosporangium sp. AC04546]
MDDVIAAWPAEFEALLREQLHDLPRHDPIPAGTSLIELGLDSLGAVSLITEAEEAFGVSFGEELLDPRFFSSAAHLWSVVERLRAEQGVTA